MANLGLVNFPNFIGTYASTAQLPNVSGATLQLPANALEIGDHAYVTGAGLYQCISPTPGAATWGKVVVADASGNVDIGAGNLATSGTVDGRDVSVDGAKLDTITSGTWTPVGTIVSNMDSVTPGVFSYIKHGSQVFFSGPVAIDATAAGAAVFRLSLPFASNFTAASDASGMSSTAGRVYADSATDLIEVYMNSPGTSAFTIAVFGSYQVKP